MTLVPELSHEHRGVPMYVARPDDPRAALVVVQEAFGVNDHIKDVCHRLAAHGYLAVAPALFHRLDQQLFSYDGIPAAKAQLAQLTPTGVVEDIGAAVDWLDVDGAAPGRPVGVIGFCFGGKASFLAATQMASLRACVAFYGAGIGADDEAAPVHAVDQIQCPVLAVYGGGDPMIPAEEVDRVRERLDAAGVPHIVRVYPGVDHGFACNARPANYSPEAAAAAWDLTLSFLERTLR